MNTVFEQRFAFSLVVFCSHAAFWCWFFPFAIIFGKILTYDVTTTSNLLLVHAISTELRALRHFSLFLERVFCSFAWLSFWSHVAYLTLKNDFLALKLTFLYLIQRDKVSWMCVTLNEGYLRAANRGSNYLYRFLIEL